jgi:hypothetical protein
MKVGLSRRVGLIAVLAALAAAGQARAAGDSLTLSANAGASDATGVVITASGVTDVDNVQVVIHYQSPSQPCSANPDGNPPLDPDGTVVSPPGSFSIPSSQPNQLLPGRYRICGWLVDLAGPTTVAHTSLDLTVASADTMSLVFTPQPEQGRQFNVYAVGKSSDPAGLVDATYKPAAGGTCATTFFADHGKHVDPGENSSGTGTGSYDTLMSAPTFLAPGTYLFCGWMYDQATNEVLATARSVISVPPLHATMKLDVPGVSTGAFTVRLSVTLDYGVPVTAWVDVMPDTGHGCPSRPGAEPRSANNVIDQDIEVSKRPAGTTTVKAATSAVSGGRQLVCAWLLDNWSVNVNPKPVVAGPVAARVSIAHGKLFKGHTSQHFSITLAAAPLAKNILGAQFNERLHCNGTPLLLGRTPWNRVYSETLTGLIFGVARPDKHGRFKIRQNADGRTTILHGRVMGKTITGTFTDSGPSWAFTGNHAQSLRCTTGTVHFSARSK